MNLHASDERDALAKLLQQAGQRDSQAFADLYQRTSAKLYGVCLRMLRERSEAEDALQNVYMAVWRRADRFDPARAAAMTWLIALARNQCIDRLRRHRESPLGDAVADAMVDPQPGPPAHTESSEQRRRLEQCLDTLAAQQQSAVRAAFFTGATYNELAERHSVPLATMKSWIRRSLIRLRGCLEHSNLNP
ncbi:MAG: sigma-70 family RNA polymerase sigma factor [Rhodanobacteraceae bacterium]